MKYLFSVCLIIIASPLFAQEAFKFRITRFAITLTGKHADSAFHWKKCSDLIVIQEKKVILYSHTTQQYDIIKDLDPIKTEKGTTFIAEAIDNKGDKCKVMYYLRKIDKKGDAVIVQYPQLTIYFEGYKTN